MDQFQFHLKAEDPWTDMPYLKHGPIRKIEGSILNQTLISLSRPYGLQFTFGEVKAEYHGGGDWTSWASCILEGDDVITTIRMWSFFGFIAKIQFESRDGIVCDFGDCVVCDFGLSEPTETLFHPGYHLSYLSGKLYDNFPTALKFHWALTK